MKLLSPVLPYRLGAPWSTSPRNVDMWKQLGSGVAVIIADPREEARICYPQTSSGRDQAPMEVIAKSRGTRAGVRKAPHANCSSSPLHDINHLAYCAGRDQERNPGLRFRESNQSRKGKEDARGELHSLTGVSFPKAFRKASPVTIAWSIFPSSKPSDILQNSKTASSSFLRPCASLISKTLRAVRKDGLSQAHPHRVRPHPE